MSRDKQIEEMTVEFAKINCNPKGCYNCNLCDEYGSLELNCEDYLSYRTMAETFYNAGYRKVVEQSETARECEKTVDKRFPSSVTESATRAEVAREIFAEIEKAIADLEYRVNTPRKTVRVEELKAQVNWVLHDVVPTTLAELKKKYIGEDTNVTTKDTEGE